MFKKLSTKLLGAATAMSLLCGMAAAADWRVWNIHNDGHPNTAAMDRFAELVNEGTKGEIKVQVFHGGVLGSQPDAIEQVRIGAIEVGNFNLGRREGGGEAVLLLSVDQPIPADVVTKAEALEGVKVVTALAF